jgi:membrane protein required for colicin V production
MELTDIILLVTLLIPGVVGALYGFLNIIFSIVAWGIAFGISFKFGADLAPMLVNYIETPILQNIAAFAGLFIASLMIFSLLSFFIVKLIGKAGLTATDRILGLFLGIGLGDFIIAFGVFLAGFTGFPEEPWWNSSLMIEPFQRIAQWSHLYLPEDISSFHGYGEVQIENEI